MVLTIGGFLALTTLVQAQTSGPVIVNPSDPSVSGPVIVNPPGPVIVNPGSMPGPVIVKPGDASLVDGCWAEIYEDDDFDQDDPHVILKGPFESATLKDLAGRNWNNDIESIVMGPRATMYAYKDKDFKDTEIVFAPNQRVKNLSEVKMKNDIESLRLKCG